MSSGSYRFDRFSDPGSEAERLKTQATSVSAFEAALLAELGIADSPRILEVGAGPGFVTRLLASSAPRSTIVSLDYSLDLLRQLKTNIDPADAGRILAACALAETLPLPNNEFHFAYARFLLQHVPSPLAVTREIHRCLREDGTICVVDSDDSLVLHYPEQPQIVEFLEKAQLAQTAAGGDRHIGRKLQYLLHKAGFSNIRTRIFNFTSTQMELEVLMGMALGYKAELLGKKTDLASWISHLKPLAEQGAFHFSTGICLAIGSKAK